MLSCQYRKSHCGEKTVVRSSYLHNGISYIGKITSLYWIRALVIMCSFCIGWLFTPPYSKICTYLSTKWDVFSGLARNGNSGCANEILGCAKCQFWWKSPWKWKNWGNFRVCNWLNCLCKTQVHGWLAKTMDVLHKISVYLAQWSVCLNNPGVCIAQQIHVS